MSDSRDAFVEKFRSNLRARVQKLRDMLEILEHIPDSPEALSQVHGELHTLKGEARLLGLLQLSDLAHALETLLGHPTGDATNQARFALEAMAKALADRVSREDADALLLAALHRLDVEIDPLASPEVEPQSDQSLDSSAERANLSAGSGTSSRWVQVDAGLIDELCETMAAISGDFGRIYSQAGQVVGSAREGNGRATSRQFGASLLEECARFRSALDDATVRTWELRLVPAQPLLRELADHARQLASSAGKAVAVNVDAGAVQIERDALDKVWDALLHLARNSIDHGLEISDERGTKSPIGNLDISARSVGTSVTLTVADDGRGIDADQVRAAAVHRGILDRQAADAMSDDEVVQLVFEKGFSTRDTISTLSGRGVGLDVVKLRTAELGGRVSVHTQKGQGTRFSLTLPFTLTKERLLTFELAGGLYAFPAQSVRAVIGGRELAAALSQDGRLAWFDGEPVPLLALAPMLGRELEPSGAALLVVLREQLYGLLVAKVVGERQLIRRPAEPLLARHTAVGASAVMEDGRAVLVLDLDRIGRGMHRGTASGGSARGEALSSNAVARVLLVDDSPVIREMVSEILSSAGLLVSTAENGKEAIDAIALAEPDLVISDVEMPQMDGFALLELIRQRSERLPVVMLTTRASVQDRQRATRLGANAYVLKSDFRSRSLLDVVQRFLPLHRHTQ